MDIIQNDPPPCPSCRALGDFEHEGVQYQLYFCLLRLHSLPIVDPDWPTLMARFGDGPSDFLRGWSVAGNKPVLAEAERRAVDARLYDPKKPLHPGVQEFFNRLADMLVADLIKRPPPPEPTDANPERPTEVRSGRSRMRRRSGE